MGIEKYPSIDFVRQCLREDNGRLFWLNRPVEHFFDEPHSRVWNGRYAGREAGQLQRPHVTWRWFVSLTWNFKTYRLPRYRIIWAFYHQEWRLDLDHENGVSTDDKIGNLRIATRSQNSGNTKMYKNNTSGIKGVSWSKRDDKWVAQITINNRRTPLGKYADIEDAKAAYNAAANAHWGEFFCDGTRPDIEAT